MEKTKIITIAIIFTISLIVILGSRSKSSKQYEVRKAIRLFPFWVKYLGIVISILSILIHWSYMSDELTVLSSFWDFGLVIGLIIISLSKERNEDEMTMSIRLNSVFISFFLGILFYILFQLLARLDGENVSSHNSLYVTTYILLSYVLIFHLTKKRMR